VTLTASLTGSFGDVATLKGAAGTDAPSPGVAASPLRTTDQTGGAPVSTIAIPADATPGLYDLSFAIESLGPRLSGESVVQIEPAAAS